MQFYAIGLYPKTQQMGRYLRGNFEKCGNLSGTMWKFGSKFLVSIEEIWVEIFGQHRGKKYVSIVLVLPHVIWPLLLNMVIRRSAGVYFTPL